MKSVIAIFAIMALSVSASVPVITECAGNYTFLLDAAEAYTVPANLQKGSAVSAFVEGIMT